MAGWPLQRKIRIVRLKDSFVSKAIQHFLLLAPKKIAKVRPPDLAAQNGRIDEIRMIPNVVKHPNRNSPPKLGGVAARSIKSREATLFRADGVVLGLGTTPSRLMKRRRATPLKELGKLSIRRDK